MIKQMSNACTLGIHIQQFNSFVLLHCLFIIYHLTSQKKVFSIQFLVVTCEVPCDVAKCHRDIVLPFDLCITWNVGTFVSRGLTWCIGYISIRKSYYHAVGKVHKFQSSPKKAYSFMRASQSYLIALGNGSEPCVGWNPPPSFVRQY